MFEAQTPQPKKGKVSDFLGMMGAKSGVRGKRLPAGTPINAGVGSAAGPGADGTGGD